MKRGTPRHPKVGKLCELLKIDMPTAVGILELLWHFTAEFAPQGDIGKFDDYRIEAGLLSTFRPKGKLVLALIQAGWIDQDDISRLIVHDWCDHADASVRKRLERAGLQFVSVTPKVTEHRTATQPDGEILPYPIQSNPSPEPSPVPEPEPDGYPRASQKTAKTRETAALCPSPPGDELTQTLRLWPLAFPFGPTGDDLHKIRSALNGTPEKAFCAHLDAMKSCFQPGGKQEPEKPGFFVSVARNFAKDYNAVGIELPNAKMLETIEIPGRKQ